ncbi:hypothetical protein ACWD5V_00450 [Streptomyces sp. NPDC002523]
MTEPARMPHGAERRRGVPRARHTHRLLPTAEAGLERLFPGIGFPGIGFPGIGFPGIGRDLAAAGAVRVRMSC